jgi:hypothetical protein
MNRLSRGTVLSFLFAVGLASAAAGQVSLANPASLPRVAPSPASPSTFGTTQTSYRVVTAPQITPFNSAVTYDDLGNGSNRNSRYATGGFGVFVAGIDLPSGALITSLEMDACDSNATGDHAGTVLGFCDKFGLNCLAISSILMTVSDAVVPCKATTEDLTSVNHTVDNLTNNYFVEVLTTSLDSSNSFSAARIGYRLQVSPASVQTFNDVPPADFGYQFIEALAASGITGGCQAAPPLYCPDAPVTRRQMAIFIAKALGLQWQ